ncbi:hypothetical protein BDV38DRAFT_243207 [Aspergillus pseudotamarii]|uniref:Uncharacterized protein n=1 Tax=Aspergillus pseudotamarii TaxID=132259 RepID=A0A5N6T0A9_ASPPS|nr:uncharacterized protein BDV38DRAFT_243207 [Aspergillus pseudotamarii]KAE8138904.1 hypothetical protein BDV38DRAFT_243207 [Aspergillus pseudotamarii]
MQTIRQRLGFWLVRPRNRLPLWLFQKTSLAIRNIPYSLPPSQPANPRLLYRRITYNVLPQGWVQRKPHPLHMSLGPAEGSQLCQARVMLKPGIWDGECNRLIHG